MRLQTLKGKVKRNFTDYGFWVTFKKIVFKVFELFYTNVNMIIYKIDIPNYKDEPATPNSLSFRILKAKDHEFINQIEKMEEWLDGTLESRLSANGICMSILDDNKLIGFYLASHGEAIVPQLKLKVILSSDEIWADQMTIHNNYRRIGLATQLKYNIYKEFKKREIKSVYAATRIYNIAVLRSATKFPLKKIWHLKYFNIFGSKKLILRNIPVHKIKLDVDDISAYLNKKYAPAKKVARNVNKTQGFFQESKKKKHFFELKISELL